MIESIFAAKPELDPIAQKKLLHTYVAGVAIVLGLTLMVYACLLTATFPLWVGPVAFLAQGWTVSALVARVHRLRKRSS